ncbi:protein phosphatase 2C domain-containing protein [Streptomyces sp. NPDC020096]
MSHQGEQHHHDDAWWRRLYDDDGTPDLAGAPADGSFDEHFDTALRAFEGPPPTPPDPRPPAAATPPATAGLPVAHSPSSDPPRPLGGPPPGAAAPPPHLPPVRSAVKPATPPAPPPDARTPVPRQGAASTPGAPWTPTGAFGPPLDPSPPPAAPSPPEVIHVGDRPPTYDAEPTAWPSADPERLDGLVPDTVLDGARYGLLTVRAVSGRGDSARYRGAPRADALLTARFGSGDDALLFIAVAGGARAAEDGPRAARDACHALGSAVGRSRSRLAEDIRSGQRGALKAGLRRLTARAYGKLHAEDEPTAPPGEFVASLRCLLLPVDPECRTRVFFGVGSGGLFRLRDGQWQDLDPDGEPEDEEGLPGRRFRFRASVAQCGDTLLLCGAGLADPLREVPELSEHLARRWGRADTPPGLAAFLADTAIRVKGYADDRTAVAVWEG